MNSIDLIHKKYDFLLYTADSAADRFVVFHSSSLDKRKLKILNSKIEKEKLELIKKAEEEGKREFFCEEDARAEIDKFQKKNKSKFHTIESEIIVVKKKDFF